MIKLQNAIFYDKKIHSSKKWNFNPLSGTFSSNSIFLSSDNKKKRECLAKLALPDIPFINHSLPKSTLLSIQKSSHSFLSEIITDSSGFPP